MRSKLNLILVVLAMLLLVPPVSAQTTDYITLEAALDAAVANVLSIREAQVGLDKALAGQANFGEKRQLQWSLSMPKVELDDQGFGFQKTWELDGRNSTPNSFQISVGNYRVGPPFRLEERLTFTYKRQLWPNPWPSYQLETYQTNLAVDNAQHKLNAELNDVLIETYRQYRNLQLDAVELAVVQEQGGLAEQELARQKRLLDLGESTPEQVNLAQANWLRSQAKAEKEKALLQSRWENFLTTLGLPNNRRLEPLEKDFVRLAQDVITKASPADSEPPAVFFANQTNLRNLRADLELKERQLTIAEGAAPWQVDLTATTSTDASFQVDNWSVAVGANLDLSGQQRRAREVTLARQEVELARQRLAVAEATAATEYRETWVELEYQRALLAAALLDWEISGGKLTTAQQQQRLGLITARELDQARWEEQKAQVALGRGYVAYVTQNQKLRLLRGETVDAE